IERLMSLYPDRHSATLPALGAAQAVHGWCSDEAIRQVAAVMQVTPAYLSSVATFYDMLRTERPARAYVYVCTRAACTTRSPRRPRRRAWPTRWTYASSSASARATWRRWRPSTVATWGRSR